MKIATLTYQRHDNIGAMLQCYALQQTIIRYGYENYIIDYICNAADRTFGLESLRVKGINKYLTSCIGVISRIPKKRAFTKFRKNDLIMTKKCDRKTVKKYDKLFDGFIVGSDNVWNSRLTGLDTTYFLDFVSDNAKKTSYAASLGLANVPMNEQTVFAESLKKFSFISLREQTAAANIASLTGMLVCDTCDPTFFLNIDEWSKLAVEPREKYKYVLVYQMSPSASFVRFAKEFGKQKHLPLIYIPFPYGICKCCMKPQIGPHEWLGYVKNAEYVITDSFHGCVFTSIFERNLIIKISQLGARINNLTEKLGISDRVVTTVKDAVNLPAQNYETVRLKLCDYKVHGEKVLEQILNGFGRRQEKRTDI